MLNYWRLVGRTGVLLTVLCSVAAPAQAVRNVTINPVADLGLYSTMDGQNISNRGGGGRMDMTLDQTCLMKFDILSSLNANESVIGATLQTYVAREGLNSTFDIHAVAYPLAAAWQEGTGTSAGVAGDLGFPWGPTTVGDAVWAYRQTTAVGFGSGSFASILLATAGVAWNTAGGRGIGTDVQNRLMIDQDWKYTYKSPDPVGKALPALTLTADGVAVLRAWSTNPAANYGLNIWASLMTGTKPATSLTREYATAAQRPQLILTISLTGDIDGDSHVNATDLVPLASTFGKSLGGVGYNANGDLNGNGTVNVVDLLMLAGNYGQ